MYCRNCGSEIDAGAATCVKCGFSKGKGSKFCQHCGEPTQDGQAICTKCGFKLTASGGISSSGSSKDGWYRSRDGKILAGVFAGLGKKFNVEPWILRIIMIILQFVFIGWPLDIIYIIMALALKYDD